MTFELIYQTNSWQGDESLSGPGSGSAATAPIIPWLRRIVQEEIVLSILDIGCGDGFWMPELTVTYTGIDASETAIARSMDRHPIGPRWRYIHGDAAVEQLPKVDLVLIRDVIQHLSYADALALLANVRRTGSRLLLASTYVGGTNRDVETGDAYSPDLTAAPFSLPAPELLVFDGAYYHFHETKQQRDPSKYLGLWRL